MLIRIQKINGLNFLMNLVIYDFEKIKKLVYETILVLELLLELVNENDFQITLLSLCILLSIRHLYCKSYDTTECKYSENE